MIKVTERDKIDPWWIELKADLESRLMILREANDHDKTDIETAKHRGRIVEIKRLIDVLGMGKPKPKIDVE